MSCAYIQFLEGPSKGKRMRVPVTNIIKPKINNDLNFDTKLKYTIKSKDGKDYKGQIIFIEDSEEAMDEKLKKVRPKTCPVAQLVTPSESSDTDQKLERSISTPSTSGNNQKQKRRLQVYSKILNTSTKSLSDIVYPEKEADENESPNASFNEATEIIDEASLKDLNKNKQKTYSASNADGRVRGNKTSNTALKRVTEGKLSKDDKTEAEVHSEKKVTNKKPPGDKGSKNQKEVDDLNNRSKDNSKNDTRALCHKNSCNNEKKSLKKEIAKLKGRLEKRNEESQLYQKLNIELQTKILDKFEEQTQIEGNMKKSEDAIEINIASNFEKVGHVRKSDQTIHFGRGLYLPLSTWDHICVTSPKPSSAVGQILVQMFGESVLLKSTVSGKLSNRSAKKNDTSTCEMLDPVKLSSCRDIYIYWLRNVYTGIEKDCDIVVETTDFYEYVTRKIASLKKKLNPNNKKSKKTAQKEKKIDDTPKLDEEVDHNNENLDNDGEKQSQNDEPENQQKEQVDDTDIEEEEDEKMKNDSGLDGDHQDPVESVTESTEPSFENINFDGILNGDYSDSSVPSYVDDPLSE